jgi:hypothetical protein
VSLATLQLSIVPKRMLTQAEAAHHCGRPLKRFRLECPVKPIVFPNGDKRFDLNDLDGWLDSMKSGDVDEADEILARLG